MSKVTGSRTISARNALASKGKILKMVDVAALYTNLIDGPTKRYENRASLFKKTTMALGRPRGFDAEAMLDKVVDVFWTYGYEGSTMATLTAATGLSKPSLYAAFGSKDALFRAAFARYRERQAVFTGNALNAPQVKIGVERLLLAVVDSQTQPGMPHGCLMVHGSLVGSPESEDVRKELTLRRKATEVKIRERLARAKMEGELGAEVDVADLARYIATVIQGLAVQAAGGATRKALHRVVQVAMTVWPGRC